MRELTKKENKRKQLARLSCDLFIEQGFVNISISQIAQNAQIGKGTIYEYFQNKEDIVFEIMSCLQEDYDPKLRSNLLGTQDTKQKVIFLFDLFINDDPIVQKQRQIYKEFLAIYLSNPTQEIIAYQKRMKNKYTEILLNIFSNAIQTNELVEESLELVSSIFATIEGYFIIKDDKQVIINYIDSLFKILDKKGIR